ncbi:MAG: hypothetical protein C4K49_12215 [Candidatus Thorarchaeota archaeon]|nr:MAG: hypothetical protein C4K49_12215 [Candidatus Thorarchaeota archaeon]
MKLKSIAYSVYLVLSILVSMSVASVPAMLLMFLLFHNVDPLLDTVGWPFAPVRLFVQSTLGPFLPEFVPEKLWFIILFVPSLAICYGIFLGILALMFKGSRRLLPHFDDGYYTVESEQWLTYEYYESYYVIFAHFTSFFSVFLDTKPRHTLFGAKIGKNTIVGNGRLFNPERTVIGSNCFFGYNAIMSGHVYEGDRLYLKTVRIGNNVTVGANAVILAGANIGDNVIVGANTVVPKDRAIPPNTIWINGKAIPKKPEVIVALQSQGAIDSHIVVNGSVTDKADDPSTKPSGSQ